VLLNCTSARGAFFSARNNHLSVSGLAKIKVASKKLASSVKDLFSANLFPPLNPRVSEADHVDNLHG
jgi:hypothetical protein